MGISLYGLTPATTYDALIKTGDNEPLTASLKVLSDGVGTNLPMEASTTGINFTGTTTVGGVAVANTTQVAAKQDTLVSGTNIKTINGTSVLGSGNIVTPTTPPSGVSGAIQFSNGSAFASDAANLFWDDTNNRLGVGTNVPDSKFQVVTGGSTGFRIDIGGTGNGNNYIDAGSSNTGFTYLRCRTETSGPLAVNFVNGYTSAMLAVKGSGSTSATTSLLVQNSAGTESFKVQDNGNATVANRLNLLDANNSFEAPSGTQITANAYHGFRVIRGTGVGSTMFEVFDNSITPSGLLVNVKNSSFANMFAVNYLGQASMGTASPNASAQFQINSTTRGFLPPVMTTTQKNAIASPATGLVLYDATTNKLQCYNGSTWNDLF